MARNIVSQELSKRGPIFPECFVADSNGKYDPDPAAIDRTYGWLGDPWRTRATMIKFRLNQGSLVDCPAYLLGLTDNGDMYLIPATDHAALPAGTKVVAGVTRYSSIERVALRLQEATQAA